MQYPCICQQLDNSDIFKGHLLGGAYELSYRQGEAQVGDKAHRWGVKSAHHDYIHFINTSIKLKQFCIITLEHIYSLKALAELSKQCKLCSTHMPIFFVYIKNFQSLHICISFFSHHCLIVFNICFNWEFFFTIEIEKPLAYHAPN